MKELGTLLVLLGALALRHSLLRRRREKMEAGEELCRCLDLLRRGIFVLRLPLPRLVEECRQGCRLTAPFWGELARSMAAQTPFPAAWQGALEQLDEPYAALLAPAGQALTAGEREELIDLTREEVYRAVQEERRQRGEQSRLITALCLSGALLLIVVLL